MDVSHLSTQHSCIIQFCINEPEIRSNEKKKIFAISVEPKSAVIGRCQATQATYTLVIYSSTLLLESSLLALSSRTKEPAISRSLTHSLTQAVALPAGRGQGRGDREGENPREWMIDINDLEGGTQRKCKNTTHGMQYTRPTSETEQNA